jgi:hypothetical protein
MTRPRRKAGFGSSLLLLLVASLGAPSTARAQVVQADAQQKAAAEALFDEGRQLLAQGQYENACRRFEQSQEIDPAVGILLYLGDCYERVGKLASAWAIFREAHSKASAAGQADRARIADERARKLSLNLSKLVLLVPQEDRTPGFELLLDGRAISSGLFGVPFPVDAGTHELTARAPGRKPWSIAVEVKPNADYRNVQIPVLAAGPAEPEAALVRPPPADPGLSVEQAVAPPKMTHPGPDHTAAYILGGAGVVALGVGAVFGLRASDKDEESKADCPSNCTSPEGADLNEQARSSALIANISYGVGAAALLTSAYLLFVAGSGSESASRDAPGLALGAGLGPGEGRVSLSGSF